VLTAEERARRSKASSGSKSHFYGKEQSGPKNPMYGKAPWNKGLPSPMRGKSRSPETVAKIKAAKQNVTAETREKLRVAGTGRKRSPESIAKQKANHPDFSGSGNPMYGKTRSPETIAKQKENHADVSGPNNPAWEDGKSFEPYGMYFNDTIKEFIRDRDNHTCQICGRKEGKRKLSIHHVDYDKKNNDPKNLIALCRSCHALTNFHRAGWTAYFQEMLLNPFKHIPSLDVSPFVVVEQGDAESLPRLPLST
jgi:hypothetical protein